MDYSEALRYLQRFVNFELAPSSRYGSRLWDLDGFRRFLDDLDRPERAFPSVLIAGTKGKGSVAAILASALRAAGHRTGLYTSPHLASPCERIAVDGAPISEAGFAARIAEIAPRVEAREPVPVSYRTWFEIVTAAAFLEFRAARVEIAVLEVGMGGRLDATNVVEPLASAITSISRDHTRSLGSTVAAIAREKAGVLRCGKSAVVSPQPRSARRAILAEARRLGARVHEAGRDFRWAAREVGPTGSLLDYEGNAALAGLRLGLAGPFQLENAAVAIRALEILGGIGFPVPEAALRAGLAAARWPGRFELVPGEPAVLLDGAHNVYSTEVLVRSVAEVFPGRRVVVLFGASRDKEWGRMLAALERNAAATVFTEAATPRATPAAALLAHAERTAPGTPREAIADPALALARARAFAGPADLVLVTGSLYLVGAVREVLRAEGKLLAAPPKRVLESTPVGSPSDAAARGGSSARPTWT